MIDGGGRGEGRPRDGVMLPFDGFDAFTICVVAMSYVLIINISQACAD